MLPTWHKATIIQSTNQSIKTFLPSLPPAHLISTLLSLAWLHSSDQSAYPLPREHSIVLVETVLLIHLIINFCLFFFPRSILKIWYLFIKIIVRHAGGYFSVADSRFLPPRLICADSSAAGHHWAGPGHTTEEAAQVASETGWSILWRK